MPPNHHRPDHRGTKEQRLRSIRSTKSLVEFQDIHAFFPDRPSIIAEGDSWFGYPPPWLFRGPASNILDWLAKSDDPRYNLLRMERNGDEAADMLSGKSKHRLCKVLSESGEFVKAILFSGGGNDIVGEWDFPFLLKQPGDDPTSSPNPWVNERRLRRKIATILNAYLDLAALRNDYAPQAAIVTHTYDTPLPSDTGGVFVGGVLKTKAWMKRFMDAIGVPAADQPGVIGHVLMTFAKQLLKLPQQHDWLTNFHVVDTQGTLLKPDGSIDDKLWLNEIHPTSEGFRIVTNRIRPVLHQAINLPPPVDL